jgi:1,4-alpha-glucan branching enzyme
MMFMGTEGHLDGYWDPSLNNGDHRIDWLQIGDGLGAPMQRMVRDINGIRWVHAALRSPGGSVVHVDDQNQVAGFKRYDLNGDVVLVVVNASDSQWSGSEYGVSMGGETGGWMEIFNSQAPVYGGVNTVGNYGMALNVSGGSLWINLPSWCVLVFAKS